MGFLLLAHFTNAADGTYSGLIRSSSTTPWFGQRSLGDVTQSSRHRCPVRSDERGDGAAFNAAITWREPWRGPPRVTSANYAVRGRALEHASRRSRVPVTCIKTSSAARRCNNPEGLWFLQQSGNYYWK